MMVGVFVGFMLMFAAGPVAVFVMLERSGAETTGQNTTIALEPNAAISDDEIYRLFHSLRSQYLDSRAESITWWLMAATVSMALVTAFVTALGLIIVIAGFIGYQWFKDILDEARRYTKEAGLSAEEAQTVAERARATGYEAERLAAEASESLARTRETEQRAHEVLQTIRSSTAADLATSNRFPGSMELTSELGGASPIDRAALEAFQLQRSGEIAQAIAKWRSIANILEGIDDERAARAWASVGYLFGSNGEHEKAIGAYDSAIRINPDYSEALNNRGVDKEELGFHEDAIADFDQAIRLNPEDHDHYNNRGNSKSALGLHDEAIADYKEAIRLNADDPTTWYNMGVAKSALGMHVESVEDYDEAIRLNPELGRAYVGRGNAKSELGMHEEAIADYNEAIRKEEDNAEAFHNRGRSHHAQGNFEEARSDYTQAIQLGLDDVLSYYGLGTASASLGDISGAISAFSVAISLANQQGDSALALQIQRESAVLEALL